MKKQLEEGLLIEILYYAGLTVLLFLFIIVESAWWVLLLAPLLAFLYGAPTIYKKQRNKFYAAKEWNLYQREINLKQWDDYYSNREAQRNNNYMVREQQLRETQEDVSAKQHTLDNSKDLFEMLDNIDRHLITFVPLMNGETYERYVGYMLLRLGWKNIEYTKASGDYGTRTCIQCKRYDGGVGIDAVQEALSGASYYDCNSALVVTNSYFTKAAQELAQKTGVHLIDNFG